VRAEDSDRFATSLSLAPGLYTYKFIVDGVWLVSPREPTADDGKGNGERARRTWGALLVMGGGAAR